MVRKCKFIIGKSKSSRLTLEQRLLGYNRQLTKLQTRVNLITAWISNKFGVLFLDEASARVQLVALSKHLSLVKSTAPKSVNPSVKKAKQKLQSVPASGGQDSGSDDSAESDVLVDDSDVDEADKDAETSGKEPVIGRISLEDAEPERRRRIPLQRKSKRKIPRNTMARLEDGAPEGERPKRQQKNKVERNKVASLSLPVGFNNGQEVKGRKNQRPRRTLAAAPDKGHTCKWPYCKKYLSKNSDLARHERSHSGVKPFKCTWLNCGKSFTLSCHLTTHRRIHTGEKPYICTWPNCDKSFSHCSKLQLHTRTHTGERPFKCGFCDYRCATGSNLTSHVRVHTAEKPYKCCVCAATFTRSNQKVRHEKVHH